MPPLSSEHSLLLSRSVGGVCAGDVASRARGGRFLMVDTRVEFRLGFRLGSGGRAKGPDFLLLHPLHHSPRQQPRKRRLQDTHNNTDSASKAIILTKGLTTSYNKKHQKHQKPITLKQLRSKTKVETSSFSLAGWTYMDTKFKIYCYEKCCKSIKKRQRLFKHFLYTFYTPPH